MAFSRSGSLITQTGTDTNLSGITSALGSSNIFSNGGTAPLNRTVYDLATPNYRLRINGTLSVDPANEEIWLPGTNNAIQVGGSGTFNLGGSRTFSGGISYSKEQAIFCDVRGSSHTAGNPWLDVLPGGEFNWDGGVITMHAAGDFLRGGTINAGTLRQGIQLSSSSSDTYALFLEDCTINDLLIDGRTRLVIRNAAVTINAITLLHTAGLFADGNVAPNLTSYPPVENYDRQFVEKDYNYWRGGKLRLRNSSIGSNAIATGNGITSANSTGLLAIEQDLTITIVDSTGTAITSGLWFIRDVDNGNRQNAGYVGGSGASNAAVDLTADNTYTANFGAGGTHAAVTIVTAYGNRTSASSNEVGTYDTGPNRYDRRTKNDVAAGVNLDELDIFIWSYLYLPTTLTPSLIGLGGTELTTTLFDDTAVTETTLATVQAYTQITTLARLYDRAKAFKLTSADIEFPAGDEFVFLAAGGDVTMNVNEIVIGSSGGAFSVNKASSIVTINTGGALATGGQFDRLVIGASQTGSITGTASISANLRIDNTGDFTLADIGDLTGSLTLGGDLTVNAAGGGTMPSGSFLSTGNMTVSASNGAGTDEFDARNMTFDASSTITNTSGNNITVVFSPGQTRPTKVETSGTITFENFPVDITITVVDTGGNPIENARVFLEETVGGADIINSSLTNASGVVTATFAYDAADVAVTGRARKSSAGDVPRYRTAGISGTITTAGFSVTVTMVEDE